MIQDDPSSLAAQEQLSPQEFQGVARAIQEQISRVIVGQGDAVRGVLLCLIAGGHVLLEGVPGLGKTSLVRAVAQSLDLQFGRIQFTPDLMPADITGGMILSEETPGHTTLTFQPGPIFANLVLADEINRATPKTQSALLEAMQEGTVTSGTRSRDLPRPFYVLATQNPVEMQGTYPLPEAQLDRFLLKLHFVYPSVEELDAIVIRTSEPYPLRLTAVANADLLERMRLLADALPMAQHVVRYASRVVLALQPDHPTAPEIVRRFVRRGPSPRGAQSLCMVGRVVALLDGRFALAYADIRAIAPAALRHRLSLHFEAERQGISPDMILADVLKSLPEE